MQMTVNSNDRNFLSQSGPGPGIAPSPPICIPSVGRLPPALSRQLLAETTWHFGDGRRREPPPGNFHPNRPAPCRAHERRLAGGLWEGVVRAIDFCRGRLGLIKR